MAFLMASEIHFSSRDIGGFLWIGQNTSRMGHGFIRCHKIPAAALILIKLRLCCPMALLTGGRNDLLGYSSNRRKRSVMFEGMGSSTNWLYIS
jgi:hypothetical protein